MAAGGGEDGRCWCGRLGGAVRAGAGRGGKGRRGGDCGPSEETVMTRATPGRRPKSTRWNRTEFQAQKGDPRQNRCGQKDPNHFFFCVSKKNLAGSFSCFVSLRFLIILFVLYYIFVFVFRLVFPNS